MIPGSRAVFLNSGPFGLASSPARTSGALECQQWVTALQFAGIPVYLPEIADYEVRRELLRAGKTASAARLDVLKQRTQYVPISTRAMLLAAELWAQARNIGRPTAANIRLDANVILAAQVLDLGMPGLIVATSNVRHLSRFISARVWQEIGT